ncbi:acyl-CoA dehydrogenase family protein [Sneathiella chinensis]|uniref:Acyl-CoA dehydrogenase n=1 Tax=Sneathiella chinensis TaxID=349750 RepID=A0ABQ5U0L7_9PROT|nr:acyl-CoA dehydrogenase family protein [Sneathiella chinensis]GLQ05399.1 acyl-CoA dehydrogenase [Sneathiella chinensis]
MTALRPDLQHIADTLGTEILRPNALIWEQAKSTPRSLFQAAGKVGFLSLETPTEQGGLGASFSEKLKLSRALARHSMSHTFALVNSQNIAARLASSPVARHREDIAPQVRSGQLIGCTALTEPSAGSDFAAIQTTATRDGDGWVLNGSKAWITYADKADIFMLYAQTDPEKGWRGIASFLIDASRPGFVRGEPHAVMGGTGIGAATFSLEDYRLTAEDMLSPPGEAFKIAMNSINGARTYVAGMCAGMVEDALETALAYGRERTTFGTRLIDHQGLGWSLADVATKLEILDVLSEKAAGLIDAGQDAVRSAAIAKKVSGEVTIPAIAACIQSMGANGLLEENRLGHHMICAKISAYTDGTTEMMNERIASYF